MEKCVKTILPEYKYNYLFNFKLLKNIEEFNVHFQHVEIESETPLFSIVGKSKNQWVLFCIIRRKLDEEYETTVLYKDPCGDSIPDMLAMKLDDKFISYKLIENRKEGQRYYDKVSYGPLTLRNLKILLEFLAYTKGLSLFANLDFTKTNTIKKERLTYAAQRIETISKEKPFKSSLKTFLDLLPLDFCSDVEKYRQLLAKESQNRNVNNEKIHTARMAFLSEARLKQLQTNFKLHRKKDKNYTLDIHESFPKQMQQFTNVFKFLQRTKVNKALMNILKGISRLLEIDVTMMHAFYKRQQVTQDKKKKTNNIKSIAAYLPEMKEETYSNCTSLLSILAQIVFGFDSDETLSAEELERFEATYHNSKKPKENPKDEKVEEKKEENGKGRKVEEKKVEEKKVEEKKVEKKKDEEKKERNVGGEKPKKVEKEEEEEAEDKAQSQGEKEATLLDDEPPKVSRLQFLNDKIEDLAKKYELVQAKYEEWKTGDLTRINEWAKLKMGHLSLDDEDVCTALAVMDRAYNLLKGGFRLHHTQILSVLILLHHERKRSRLCEIRSGEGKTVIVSLLAGIKSLQGCSVDVITGNTILADVAVEATETFFEVFDITVGTNKKDDKIGYAAGVVFGTIQQFQYDYLLDAFDDLNIRKSRRFNVLILDEIYSMSIDKQTNVTRLCRSYPGMEFLRYIYIKIWVELHKVEGTFRRETQQKVEELLKNYPPEEAKYEIDNYFEKLVVRERTIMKSKIMSTELANFPLIPGHWEEFVTKQMPKWLKSALHAKYNCREYREYRILKDKNGQRQVLPINNLNTLRNTIWADGILQFVQLKHNLPISYETLTTTLISNVAFINKYDNKETYGVTTTLGSIAEQDFFTKIYDVTFVKIPPFIRNKFVELPGMIFEDDSWATQVTLRIAAMVDAGRAVMAIFNTEEDVMIVKAKIETLRSEQFNIRIYTTQENFAETKETLRSKDIVLAANIAAYGPSFETGDELENGGGLHVFVCFLPCSLRFERQTFGRTARQGQSGSGQLLIRQSEVQHLGLSGEKVDFSTIKKRRDTLESQQLKYIHVVPFKELKFLDTLHGLFRNLHRKKTYAATDKSHEYVLEDLEEFWAFWLLTNRFNAKTIVDTEPEEEFVKFLQQAEKIINGKVCHNPYYCVALGSYHLKNDDLGKARTVLSYVLRQSGERNEEILAGLHMKFFEATIRSGYQLMDKLNKFTKEMFDVKYEINEDYKTMGRLHLEKAEKAVEKEIEYIEKNFSVTNSDFLQILLTDEADNSIVKQIHTRLFVLKFLKGNIEQLVETLDDTREDIYLEGTTKVNVANFNEMSSEQEKLKRFLCKDILFEARRSNMDIFYSLEKIRDVSDPLRQSIEEWVRSAILLFVIGSSFPPLFKTMAAAAFTIFSEAVVDVTMEMENKPELKDPMKNELSKSLILPSTLNLDVSQNLHILLKRVLSRCQECSLSHLANIRSKALCNRLSNYVDRLETILGKKLLLAEFEEMDVVERLNHLMNLKHTGEIVKFGRLGGEAKLQELQGYENMGNLKSGIDSFKATVKEIVNTNKNLYSSITKQVMSPSKSEMSVLQIIKGFFQTLQKGIKENIRLLEKLHTTAIEKIFKALDGLTKKGEFVAVKEFLADKIVDLVMGTELANYYITADGFVRNTPELNDFVTDFAARLEKKLNGGKAKNNTEKVIGQILGKLEDHFLKWSRTILQGSRQLQRYGVGAFKMFRGFAKACGCVRNDYDIVGVSKKAELQQVKDRYRAKVLMISEDTTKDVEERLKELDELEAAYNNILKKIKK